MKAGKSDRKLPEKTARKRQSGKSKAKVTLTEKMTAEQVVGKPWNQWHDADIFKAEEWWSRAHAGGKHRDEFDAATWKRYRAWLFAAVKRAPRNRTPTPPQHAPIISAATYLSLVTEELSGTHAGRPIAKMTAWERRNYHEARAQDIAEELTKLAGEIGEESPLWPEMGMAAHYLSVRLQCHLRELVGDIKIADHADQFNFCRWCGRRLPETAEECYTRDCLKGKPRSRWNKAEEKAFKSWVRGQPPGAGFVESDADLKAGGRKRRYCDNTCKECCQSPSEAKHVESFLRGLYPRARRSSVRR